MCVLYYVSIWSLDNSKPSWVNLYIMPFECIKASNLWNWWVLRAPLSIHWIGNLIRRVVDDDARPSRHLQFLNAVFFTVVCHFHFELVFARNSNRSAFHFFGSFSPHWASISLCVSFSFPRRHPNNIMSYRKLSNAQRMPRSQKQSLLFRWFRCNQA